MGMMDKFLNAMQLNDNDTYDSDDEGYYDDGPMEEEMSVKQDDSYVEEKTKKISKVTPMKQSRRNNKRR